MLFVYILFPLIIMWVALFVLFAVLSPGVLFTIPAMGKKMGGKVVIAIMHAILFVVIVNLLDLTEGFQPKKKIGVLNEETLLAQAEFNMASRKRQIEELNTKIAAVTEEISSADSNLTTTQNELVAAQAAFKTAQDKVSQIHTELAVADKSVLDINVKMTILTGKISASTVGIKAPASRRMLISGYRKNISVMNTNIQAYQKTINSLKTAIAARKNVQTVTTSTGEAGSTQELINEVTKVAEEKQVIAQKDLAVSDAQNVGPIGGGILSMIGLTA